MKDSAHAWPAAVVLVLGLTASGCAIDTSASADAPSAAEVRKQRKERQAQKDRRERRDRTDAGKGSAPKAEPKPKPKPKPAPAQVWTCSWSPTVDQDGHNDVLCDNGIASERPSLREWDDVVTRSEIMQAARAYARQRNAG